LPVPDSWRGMLRAIKSAIKQTGTAPIFHELAGIFRKTSGLAEYHPFSLAAVIQ
jgi:hypothetical protein